VQYGGVLKVDDTVVVGPVCDRWFTNGFRHRHRLPKFLLDFLHAHAAARVIE
jgi:hypothetical protein